MEIEGGPEFLCHRELLPRSQGECRLQAGAEENPIGYTLPHLYKTVKTRLKFLSKSKEHGTVLSH